MNAHQGNSACVLSVDRSTADVLREESKKVLEFNHDPFEDFRDLGPRAQHALSQRFRDAFAVIDAVGWTRDPMTDQRAVHIPLTDDHINQLHHRRADLAATNRDRREALTDTKSTNEIVKIHTHIANAASPPNC